MLVSGSRGTPGLRGSQEITAINDTKGVMVSTLLSVPPLHPRGPFSAGIITGAPAIQWVPRVHSQPTAEAAAAAEVSGARGGTPGVCQPRGVTVVHPGVVVAVAGGKAEKNRNQIS